MIVKELQLPEYGTLEMMLHSPSVELNTAYATKRPAIIICPGGAYAFCSARETDPPAIAFLNMGFQVFLLRYPVGKRAGEKRPLFALASAIKLVREYADEWQTDPNRIAVIGFSAGGHLAASLGVHWNDPLLAEYCHVQDSRILRPDAMILAYPVITAGPYAHRESIETVSRGCRESNYWSLETQVDEQTPPTFLWHTMDDGCVPVENSFLFAESLHKHRVACECHFFQSGPHGLSVATNEVASPSKNVHEWIHLCQNWLTSIFGELGG